MPDASDPDDDGMTFQEVGLLIALEMRAHLLASEQLEGGMEGGHLHWDLPSAQWMRSFENEATSLVAPIGGTPTSMDVLELVSDLWHSADTDEIVQLTAMMFLQRATLGESADPGCALNTSNWELMWVSCLLVAMKLCYDHAVFNEDILLWPSPQFKLSVVREAEVALIHKALRWEIYIGREKVCLHLRALRLLRHVCASASHNLPTTPPPSTPFHPFHPLCHTLPPPSTPFTRACRVTLPADVSGCCLALSLRAVVHARPRVPPPPPSAPERSLRSGRPRLPRAGRCCEPFQASLRRGAGSVPARSQTPPWPSRRRTCRRG